MNIPIRVTKVRYKANRKNSPLLWDATGKMVARIAEEVASKNNAAMSERDPRRVVAASTAALTGGRDAKGRFLRSKVRKRHRAAAIAASGMAQRDQARTNRMLTALSQTRV